jgi:hypothetical protein
MHSRHVAIAIVLAVVFLLIAAVAARAQDFSKYRTYAWVADDPLIQ